VVLTASPQNVNSWTETNIPNSDLHMLLFCALISSCLTLAEIRYIVTFFMHARFVLYMVTYMTCNHGISKISLYLLVCSDDILRCQYHMPKCNMRPSCALYCVSYRIFILQTSNWTADVEMFLWAMLQECTDYLYTFLIIYASFCSVGYCGMV